MENIQAIKVGEKIALIDNTGKLTGIVVTKSELAAMVASKMPLVEAFTEFVVNAREPFGSREDEEDIEFFVSEHVFAERLDLSAADLLDPEIGEPDSFPVRIFLGLPHCDPFLIEE